MTETEGTTVLDTRELLWKVRRYRWIALLPIVVVLCLAFFYVSAATPIYESGVIITLAERSQVSAALEPLVRSGEAREGMVEKVARVKSRVVNRTFLEGISERLGLAKDPKIMALAASASRKYPGVSPEELATRLVVASLAKKITVAPVGSSYIRIGAKDPSPDQARRLAGAIGDGLIEDTRRATLGQAQARGEFSQDQISVYAEKLRRSEDALRAYQESVIGRRVTSGPVDEESVPAVRALADGAEKEMELVKERIASDRATWTSVVGSARIPELRSARAQELEGRLRGLESSYGVAALRAGGTGSSSESASLLQQIGGVRQSLLAELEAAAHALPGDLGPDARSLAAGIALDRAVLRSLQARKARLEGMIGSYVSQARSTPREAMEMERLRNEVQTNRDLLATLQKEATSSHLSEALETSQLALRVEVVEPPQLPLRPVWPDRFKVLAGALLLGLLLSVGVLIGAERVGDILRTVEQAEQEMGTKVIGTIPRIEGWSRPGSFLQNNWAPISILTIVVLTAILTGVYTTIHSNRSVSPTTGELRR